MEIKCETAGGESRVYLRSGESRYGQTVWETRKGKEHESHLLGSVFFLLLLLRMVVWYTCPLMHARTNLIKDKFQVSIISHLFLEAMDLGIKLSSANSLDITYCARRPQRYH